MGNGSTELIYLVARALRPRQALIVAPAFSEYEHALKAAQVPVEFHVTTEAQNFTLDQPLDPRGADLVFLANPASPSGVLLPPELLLDVAAALDAAGVYLLLDEAFIDFVEEASLKTHLARFPRVLILRSFTKFFAIPGHAPGVSPGGPGPHRPPGRGPGTLVGKHPGPGHGQGLPPGILITWPDPGPWSARSGNYLLEGLNSLPGLKPFPSAVNYLLVKLTRPDWTAASLQKAFAVPENRHPGRQQFPGPG